MAMPPEDESGRDGPTFDDDEEDIVEDTKILDVHADIPVYFIIPQEISMLISSLTYGK
jgi:hypothetical protein